MKNEHSKKLSNLSISAQRTLRNYGFFPSDDLNATSVYVMKSENKFYTITPLCVAAIEGNTELAEEIVENGGMIEIPNKNLRSPLHWATCYGRTRMVQYLLQQNANPDTVPLENYEGSYNIYSLIWTGYQKALGSEVNYSGCIQEIKSSQEMKTAQSKAAKKTN